MSRREIQEREQENNAIGIYYGIVSNVALILSVIKDLMVSLYSESEKGISIVIAGVIIVLMLIIKTGTKYVKKIHNKHNLKNWIDFSGIMATFILIAENILCFCGKNDWGIMAMMVIFLVAVIGSFFYLVVFGKNKSWYVD